MLCTAFSLIMNKHLLSNVLFLDIKGYVKLEDSRHFKKYILVTVVGYLVLLSPLMAENDFTQFCLTTCKMQKQTIFGRGDF